MLGNANTNFTPAGPWVRAGNQVTVTIGRNVNDKPLTQNDWELFQAAVKNRLSALLKPDLVFGPFTGTGEWEGIEEESSVLILIARYTARAADVNRILEPLAYDYQQDCIAWSYGPNHLAAASE